MSDSSHRFTFGIPLIARTSAQDWSRVQRLLSLTLHSLAAQTDQAFAIIIAGHDKPALPTLGLDIHFLQADWPAQAVRTDNQDSGRKKYAINAHVLNRGGGFLMFLDADDWVDRRLVATVRASIGDEHVGGYIANGFVTDLHTLRSAPVPHPQVFDQDFHRLCGSSTVAKLRPGDLSPVRRDPHTILHEHYRWVEVAAEHGAALVPLDLSGNYVVNTAENHSELHGPFADWRRRLIADVNAAGQEASAALLNQFGLDRPLIQQTLARSGPV
jgi:hypothetical protein